MTGLVTIITIEASSPQMEAPTMLRNWTIRLAAVVAVIALCVQPARSQVFFRPYAFPYAGIPYGGYGG